MFEPLIMAQPKRTTRMVMGYFNGFLFALIHASSKERKEDSESEDKQTFQTVHTEKIKERGKSIQRTFKEASNREEEKKDEQNLMPTMAMETNGTHHQQVENV
ncbi:hypothetical protein PVK06_047452 [Gossypium arboreum]|uniref:Uncharacterized protein n=1 Tax=Gossypium arboreum TaxID=29729 RepID=A0ABR0MDU1_GOSAR|nr:hypothetical protein PVK06_047452 [Gossypium arboreum]